MRRLLAILLGVLVLGLSLQGQTRGGPVGITGDGQLGEVAGELTGAPAPLAAEVHVQLLQLAMSQISLQEQEKTAVAELEAVRAKLTNARMQMQMAMKPHEKAGFTLDPIRGTYAKQAAPAQ
jgi:hypothetical protein